MGYQEQYNLDMREIPEETDYFTQGKNVTLAVAEWNNAWHEWANDALGTMNALEITLEGSQSLLTEAEQEIKELKDQLEEAINNLFKP